MSAWLTASILLGCLLLATECLWTTPLRADTKSKTFGDCHQGYVRCYNSTRCIPLGWVCDGVKDCDDNSDEMDCRRRVTTVHDEATVGQQDRTTQTNSCPHDYHKCYNSTQCVPNNWICDNYKDCSDGSDEIDCHRKVTLPPHAYDQTTADVHDSQEPTTKSNPCPKDYSKCRNSSYCFPNNWICDNYKDCTDGSDEIDCHRRRTRAPKAYDQSTPSYGFLFGGPETESPRFRHQTTDSDACQSGYIKCYNSTKCIPQSWICDKYKDCEDNSDEIECYRKVTYAPYVYDQTTGYYYQDQTSQSGACPHDYHKCYNSSQCVPNHWLCDNYKDCSDGSDEIDCHRKQTYAPYVHDQSTPNNDYFNDHQETEGQYFHQKTTDFNGCQTGYVKCYNSSKCIPLSWICDNYKDCEDNSDEIECYRKTTSRPETTAHRQEQTTRNGGCQPDFVRCYNSTKCYPRSWVCDTYKDCDDNSDEIDCYRKPNYRTKQPQTTTSKSKQTTQTSSCPNDYHKCYNSSQCVPNHWLCDNYKDCSDGSDEIDCYRKQTNAPYAQDQSTPSNDYFNDQQETDSPYLRHQTTDYTGCQPGNVKCYNSSKCIPQSWVCDNYKDCEDNSDEIECYRKVTHAPYLFDQTTGYYHQEKTSQSGACQHDHHKCYNSSQCVPNNWICDSYKDCSDGSDEIDCYRKQTYAPYVHDQSTQGNEYFYGHPQTTGYDGCHSGNVKCYNSSKCIPQSWICDNYKDCEDNSDEIDCYRKVTWAPYVYDQTTGYYHHEQTSQTDSCPHDYHKCYNSSQCVPNHWICDYYKDCSDGSDEIDCYRKQTYAPHVHEQSTPSSEYDVCHPGNVKCYNSSKCIPQSWVCDNYKDCEDNSDEIDCYRKITYAPYVYDQTTGYYYQEQASQSGACPHDYHKCYNSSQCVPNHWLCDNYKDCSDGSDEIDCHRKQTYAPYVHDQSTPNNDYFNDHQETEGQYFHQKTTDFNGCQRGYVKCYNSSKCIPLSWICDNYKDCEDNSDEIECYRKTTSRPETTAHRQEQTTRSGGCQPDFVRCYNSTKCYPRSWVCDTYKDCDDNSDEIDCYRKPNYRTKQPQTTTSKSKQTTQTSSCPNDYHKCYNSSQCVPNHWLCDNYKDCSDGSDEIDCYRRYTNDPWSYYQTSPGF